MSATLIVLALMVPALDGGPEHRGFEPNPLAPSLPDLTAEQEAAFDMIVGAAHTAADFESLLARAGTGWRLLFARHGLSSSCGKLVVGAAHRCTAPLTTAQLPQHRQGHQGNSGSIGKISPGGLNLPPEVQQQLIAMYNRDRPPSEQG